MLRSSKVVSLLLILILVTVSLASPESFKVMRSQWTAHIPIRSRLMSNRRCRYCQQLFQLSRHHRGNWVRVTRTQGFPDRSFPTDELDVCACATGLAQVKAEGRG
jgi:hypothetical protein